MKHFVERFAEAAQNNWHKPAVCDYRGETFLYADVATHIAKLHIVFERLGVKVGDKIAISANNTARWGISYLAIVSYRAVAVPILNGFTAENLQKLVDHSDSVALFTERKMWEDMKAENMPSLAAAISTDDFSALYGRDCDIANVVAKCTAQGRNLH